jgi:glutamate racemase
MNDTRPIGIFDAGVGGLAVFRALIHELPYENIVYVGDTARGPYGVLSPSTIEKYALQSILYLMQQNVKLILAASCTVSSVVMETLNQKFHLPIIGTVEPCIKMALQRTHQNRIGVLGSPATVGCGWYEYSLKKKREGVTVHAQACPLLISLTKEGRIDNDVTHHVVSRYIEPLMKNRIDTLILGSVYLTSLKPAIQASVGSDVSIIDPSQEAARVTSERLKLMGMENGTTDTPAHTIAMSDVSSHNQVMGKRFFGKVLGPVVRADIESLNANTWMPSCSIREVGPSNGEEL